MDSLFQDSHRHGVILRVAETQVDHAPATRFEQSRAAIVQNDVRLAGFLPANLDVLPAQLRTDPGAESF